jgi:hypothetical protein
MCMCVCVCQLSCGGDAQHDAGYCEVLCICWCLLQSLLQTPEDCFECDRRQTNMQVIVDRVC